MQATVFCAMISDASFQTGNFMMHFYSRGTTCLLSLGLVYNILLKTRFKMHPEVITSSGSQREHNQLFGFGLMRISKTGCKAQSIFRGSDFSQELMKIEILPRKKKKKNMHMKSAKYKEEMDRVKNPWHQITALFL